MTGYKKYFVWCLILFFTNTIIGYGVPFVNLGFTNILDGGPIRPTVGWYWLEYGQYYTTKRFLDAEGKPLGGLPSPWFRNLQIISQGAYQGPRDYGLGGMPGFSITLPLVLYSKIEKNELGFADSGAGFGNVNFGIYTQWACIERKGRSFFVHRLEFDFAIPLGKNKLPEKNINPNFSFFFCGPYWAATLYLSHKWNLSWRLSYTWSAKDEKINFQAGDVLYLNYSLAYEVRPKLYVAAVGYTLWQLHNNRADGLTVDNSKEQVYGTGPGLAYFHSEDVVVLAYLYLESGARNYFQGTSFIMRSVIHF